MSSGGTIPPPLPYPVASSDFPMSSLVTKAVSGTPALTFAFYVDGVKQAPLTANAGTSSARIDSMVDRPAFADGLIVYNGGTTDVYLDGSFDGTNILFDPTAANKSILIPASGSVAIGNVPASSVPSALVGTVDYSDRNRGTIADIAASTVNGGQLYADLDVTGWRWIDLYAVAAQFNSTTLTLTAIESDGTQYSLPYFWRQSSTTRAYVDPSRTIAGGDRMMTNLDGVVTLRIGVSGAGSGTNGAGQTFRYTLSRHVPPDEFLKQYVSAGDGTLFSTGLMGVTANIVGFNGSSYDRLRLENGTSGALRVSPGGGSTTYIAAGTSGNTPVKAATGRLSTIVVTVTGSNAMNIYDNASAASGSLLFVIPANAPAGTVYPIDLKANNGIYAQGNVANPGVAVGWS